MPRPELDDAAIFESHPVFLKDSLNRQRFFWRWDTPEKYDRNLRNYFRMLTGVDRNIGRVLAALETRGVPKRVAADMLGVSRRTLQRRLQAARLAAEADGHTSWSRVYRWVLENGPVGASDVKPLARHAPDVRASLIHDLIETGWLRVERDRLVAEEASTLGVNGLAVVLTLRRLAGERALLEHGRNKYELVEELRISQSNWLADDNNSGGFGKEHFRNLNLLVYHCEVG